MRTLAPLCKIDPEEGFVMGLLHDVGDVVVLRAVDRYQAMSRQAIETEAFEYLCHKFHGSLGTLVADKWSLSPKLKALLSDHHTCPDAQDPHRVERLLLMLCDMINQMIGYAQPALYNLPQSRPVQELGLGGQAQFLTLLDKLPEQIQERVNGIN
jgi:HD-like signal output (HDOD) protein